VVDELMKNWAMTKKGHQKFWRMSIDLFGRRQKISWISPPYQRRDPVLDALWE